MRIGELAARSGATVKAVRYYESLGLLSPHRLPNGYRDFDERDVLLVGEIRRLGALGVTADDARPFVDCLVGGHAAGDDCPDSVASYRAAIAELDERIAELGRRRDVLAAMLASATEPRCQFTEGRTA